MIALHCGRKPCIITKIVKTISSTDQHSFCSVQDSEEAGWAKICRKQSKRTKNVDQIFKYSQHDWTKRERFRRDLVGGLDKLIIYNQMLL